MRELEGQIKIEFDKPLSNVELGNYTELEQFDTEVAEEVQISIQSDLPQIPEKIYRWHGDYETDIKKKKQKNKSTKQLKDELSLSKHKFDSKKLDKPSLIQPIRITGSDNSGNSFADQVSTKSAKELAKRANELLKPSKYPYIKGAGLLTEAEKIFYKYMLNCLNYDIRIMVKVRLADIIDVNEAKTRDSRAFYKIAYKHVDYVITDLDVNIICVVELDDFTHETQKAKERDIFVGEIMQECGIPFFRVGTKVRNLSRDDLKHIEYCILEYFAPTCPICGRPMEPKISHNKYNYGHRFYGCLGFYEQGENKCSYTIDID